MAIHNSSSNGLVVRVDDGVPGDANRPRGDVSARVESPQFNLAVTWIGGNVAVTGPGIQTFAFPAVYLGNVIDALSEVNNAVASAIAGGGK